MIPMRATCLALVLFAFGAVAQDPVKAGSAPKLVAGSAREIAVGLREKSWLQSCTATCLMTKEGEGA